MKSDKSLVDGTHRRLRSDIIAGQLRAGTKLKLELLAANYTVGMSSLREALTRLIGESLVVAESQRGFWVAPVSVQELEDLTRVRSLVECEALRLSMLHGDTDWELRLTDAFDKLTEVEAQSDPRSAERGSCRLEGWEQCNGSFHHALVDACRSPKLIKLRESLYLQSERYRRISVAISVGRRHVHEEHSAIFEAVLQRNAMKACRLIEYHFNQTTQVVRRSMEAGSR